MMKKKSVQLAVLGIITSFVLLGCGGKEVNVPDVIPVFGIPGFTPKSLSKSIVVDMTDTSNYFGSSRSRVGEFA